MKKRIIIIAVLVLIPILIIFFFYKPSGNTALAVNELRALFRPTQYLNYQLDIDNVSELEIMGAISLPDARSGIYTDKKLIQEIVDYLNGIPLAKANRKELPNKSPDVTICFFDGNENTLGGIWIYGQVFIEDRGSKELYRIKYDSNHIIDGIAQAVSEFTDSIISPDEAQRILTSEDYYGLEAITYLPDTNREEDGILCYGFIVDYSDYTTNSYSNTFAYVWVNSVTGVGWFEESELYANIPDSIFPVPMADGEIIPYDSFSIPDHVTSVSYGFSDGDVAEIYQAQLREAGFTDLGNVMCIESLWRLERDDGYEFMVEFRTDNGFADGFSLSMYAYPNS